jgi:hypothetical protein
MSAAISFQGTLSHSISFYDKNFKAARVFGSACNNLITALFLQIIATACKIIGHNEGHNHYSQQAFHKLILSGHLFTYGLYGKSVINFSTNLTGHAVPLKNENTNEQNELKKLYGLRFETMLQAANDTTVPIDKKRLDYYPSDRGVCLGASLDFLSRYEQMRKQGHFPLEAIKQISSLFIEGATKEAQITQLLQKAQDQKELARQKGENQEKTVKELETEQKNQMALLKKRQQEALKATSNLETLRIVHEAAREVAESTDELERKAHKNITVFNAHADLQRLKPLAKANNLNLEIEKILSDNGIQEKEAPEDFHDIIEQFSPGSYLLKLSCTQELKVGHAIAYIKVSQDEGYIFDPNMATLIARASHEQSNLLWNITKTFYNTKDYCSIVALKCTAND